METLGTYILYIMLLLGTLLFIICIYLLIRNNKVYEFRNYLIDLACKYNCNEIAKGNLDYISAYEWFVDKYTYDKMLFSFKPLKLESWYTKEEIEEMQK